MGTYLDSDTPLTTGRPYRVRLTRVTLLVPPRSRSLARSRPKRASGGLGRTSALPGANVPRCTAGCTALDVSRRESHNATCYDISQYNTKG